MVENGVSLAAIEYAKSINATTIGVARESLHEDLLMMGLNYALSPKQDVYAFVMEKTSGRGVDLILDPEGSGQDWEKNYGCLAPGNCK